MSHRELWAKLRVELHGFQTLEQDSRLFRSLVAAGVDGTQLTGYISAGRGRKKRGSAEQPIEATEKHVQELVHLGGHVAGGSAFRRWMGLDTSRDFDVFFSDLPSFVKAHLATYDNPLIDVFRFEEKPYELFDLAASKCSYSSAGYDLDPSFVEAMETGVSDIELGAIVHPLATLRRVIKYGIHYGFRFPGSKVIMLATTTGVDKDVATRALQFTA